MTLIEAAKLAREALEMWCPMTATYLNTRDEAITALNQAIAKAEQQEPVAWADMDVRGEDKGLSWTPGYFHKTPLYTAPQPRQWQGLTDGEILEAWRKLGLPQETLAHFSGGALWTEAKLKEKNA